MKGPQVKLQEQAKAQRVDSAWAGWLNGFIGVLIFSASLPATRARSARVFTALPQLSAGQHCRAFGGGLAAVAQGAAPQPPSAGLAGPGGPGRGAGLSLADWPLALQTITSAHSIVFLGLLPLSTALFAVLRGGERPKPVFWAFSLLGSALVVGFALNQGGGGASVGDALMLAAILVCGLGYAEGAKLARSLGGWQVISWALLLAWPFMAVLAWLLAPAQFSGISAPAWLSLGYVSVFSMLIGFVFWYRGLAQGGIAAVGQLQLLQPFFGLALAATLLHEQVSPGMLGVTLAVIACVAGARRFAR